MREVLAAAFALIAAFAVVTPVSAAADHAVTFVNRSGRPVWIGSTVNADG